MTSPAKFKKDKEIIAEYDTQVKGKGFEKQQMHGPCGLAGRVLLLSSAGCAFLWVERVGAR